jgi:hypothetical protein
MANAVTYHFMGSLLFRKLAMTVFAIGVVKSVNSGVKWMIRGLINSGLRNGCE